MWHHFQNQFLHTIKWYFNKERRLLYIIYDIDFMDAKQKNAFLFYIL